RGALVGCHHQVRVVAVVAAYLWWADYPAVRLVVVGEVEQARDERPVAGDALGKQCGPVGGWAVHDEAALGADPHDDGVLHHLRLDQPEDLGAEVLAAIRPAHAATGNEAEPQMHALDPRRIHPDLVTRTRLGQLGQQPGIELDRHRLAPGATVVGAIGV